MFYYNFVNQCNKKGLSPSAAAEAMGFQRSVVTRWKDGSVPRQATLQKIADYFNCSVAELTAEEEKMLVHTDEQTADIMFRILALSEQKRKALLAFLDTLEELP